MELAGIDRTTPDPRGGKILRDSSGEPTGLLRETAETLAEIAHERAQEALTAAQRDALVRREIELADRECLSKGITSFQDAGSDFETIDRLRAMAEEGKIGVRLWVMIREENELLGPRLAAYRMIGAADRHLTVRAIKRAVDGALGAHGAWLLEPYHDQPDSTGHNTSSLESLEETARLAIENDFQLCVHAIGDRANREMLDLYQRTFEAHPDKSGLRWRIEHAQHLSAEDIPRFAELGVLASMQGIHCTSDAPWVPVRLGPSRAEEGAYVWRKLIDSGARISNGTDAPVEDVDPIGSFHATVTRRPAGGEPFFPGQALTRMEALESYTIHAAHAAFEEEIKGSLTPGKLADIVVLSRDILTVPEDRITDTEVVYTIVGGKVMYERP
jgi:predicted amidohydrolase YtcJ